MPPPQDLELVVNPADATVECVLLVEALFACEVFADRQYSLIFVHGLLSDKIKTWTGISTPTPTSAPTSTFWPKDLGNDLPTARILLFGYKPSFKGFYSKAGTAIDEYSDALLRDLVAYRDSTDTVSITCNG